jgi:hypothetical protein
MSFVNLAQSEHPNSSVENTQMVRENGWHEERVESWPKFTMLIDDIVKRLPDQRHRFLYRGQANNNKNWRLESTLLRELKNGKDDLRRSFEIEQDARKEFESQAHLHMDPSFLPDQNDWLGWWALMQHYGAPTRLLDWTTSPYVAAYFAVNSSEKTDGMIWVINDWALGDRMQEQYPDDWSRWDESLTRPTNNWAKVAKSFNRNWERFFDGNSAPQMFFFQPERKSPRVVAQQGWLSTSLNLFADYETTIATLYEKHRNDPKNHENFDSETRECWKNWNSKIVIPKELKPEFLRRLQIMNITANALFPGIDGLGKSVKEFIQVEALHDRPGSSHPFL